MIVTEQFKGRLYSQPEVDVLIAEAHIDAQLVFAAAVKASGGEVTLSRADLMSSGGYEVIRYDHLDGSVTFKVETLKEHKD